MFDIVYNVMDETNDQYEYDYDRCCKAIITDFKQGRMGNITLEVVKDIPKLTRKTKQKRDS